MISVYITKTIQIQLLIPIAVLEKDVKNKNFISNDMFFPAIGLAPQRHLAICIKNVCHFAYD
jgi:hypothetical protein